MYTRAKLQFRLFSSVLNALHSGSELQYVVDKQLFGSREQGSSAIPLDNKGLGKLHIVIFALPGVCYAPKSGQLVG